MSEIIAPPAAQLVDPSGQPVQAYTPPTNSEVMAEANKSCKTCRGSGHYLTWVLVDENTQVRIPRVCKCAVRRWQTKHGKEILTGKIIAKPFVDSFTGKRQSAGA